MRIEIAQIRICGIRKTMNWQAMNFDWNQVRAFLATVEEGSLSAAARALGQTQPTLSRQVSALEGDLGVTLFERGHRAMSLTQSGLELLDHVRAMGEAASRISLTATGQSQTIEGQVSITASDVMSTHLLPPMLRRLRDFAPGIRVEVISSNSVSDLTRREADIAIRHFRPTQPDLIARRVRQSSAHLVASRGYLDRYGRPTSIDDLAEFDFIGFGNIERLLATLVPLGLPLSAGNFKTTSDSGVAIVEMIRHGLGIAVGPQEYADLHDEFEIVLPEQVSIPIDTWLVTHAEIFTSRRIRLVFDFLADAFTNPDQPAVRIS